jgi:hypothetical protein
LVAAVAAAVAVSVAVVTAAATVLDIHDCLYFCVDDGDGGGGYT